MKPVRLPEAFAFEADAEALDRWDSGVKAAIEDEGTISILDVIGEDAWTGGGVTSKRVAAALRSIGDRDVVVDLNSPGGDFFEGVAIYNMLRAHPRRVTVRVLGLAASAASVIAMAGDELLIGKAGFLMVHNAWVVAIGNRHDMRLAAETLEPFDEAMAAVYADRAGVEQKVAARWMDEETWFNGERAVSEGLADAFLPADATATETTEARPVAAATKRAEALFAKAGLSREQRRSLIGELKAGHAVADPQSPAVAGDDWMTAAAQLIETIRS
jgi:ATP-dependent protease ClpP protease subunit